MVNSMGLYLLIFFSKVGENALATLRLIVVASGKKWLGAFLQLLVSILWICVTGVVVVGIKEDPFKVFFFGLGSFLGSYVGSLMEEHLALGNNLLLVITKEKEKILEFLKKNYEFTFFENGKETTFFILLSRKRKKEFLQKIRKIDSKSKVIIENASFQKKEKVCR